MGGSLQAEVLRKRIKDGDITLFDAMDEIYTLRDQMREMANANLAVIKALEPLIGKNDEIEREVQRALLRWK